MSPRYLAFDIETAADISGPDFNWREHRPIGITCAAAVSADEPKPQVWHGRTDDGTPAARMSTEDAASLAKYLRAKVADGYTIITWNGLGFDFDVLAEESGEADLCRDLAVNHTDLMFHIFCEKGFPVSLANAAAGMGVPGKAKNISGNQTPGMWARGEHRQVLDYVAQDVCVTLQIALEAERRRSFYWRTQAGKIRAFPLYGSWLSVREALKLPEPDTSWTDDPIPRPQFTSWLRG